MSKKQTKKRGGNGPLIAVIVVLLIVTLTAFVLFVMPQLLYNENEPMPTEIQGTEPPATTAPEIQNEEATVSDDSGAAFPMSLAGGRLQIESLFQFSGINPDCGNAEGSDIASIVLKNTSDTYLASAAVTVTLTDGTPLTFAVTDLPAGKSAMTFSLENQSIGSDAACAAVACEPVFDGMAGTASDRVSVSVDGMTVSLTNTSGEDISELVVYCHSLLDEEYFGGITYMYTINDLPAGETATVTAVDCILGMTEVVRVAIN